MSEEHNKTLALMTQWRERALKAEEELKETQERAGTFYAKSICLEATIRKCKETFEYYVKVHTDKLEYLLAFNETHHVDEIHIDDVKEKIKRNQDMVNLCSVALKFYENTNKDLLICSICNEEQYPSPGGGCCKNGHVGAPRK